jgi:hypothetical protein
VSQPLSGMMTALAARYEVITQDISSMLAENEPCMWGSATLVMLVSSTCITVTIITEKVMAHLRPDPMGASATRQAQEAERVVADGERRVAADHDEERHRSYSRSNPHASRAGVHDATPHPGSASVSRCSRSVHWPSSR